MSPIHYNEFFKIWFLFLSFFLRHRNPFESHTPTRELAWQKYWFYCGLLVQCTSTVSIAKNHSLVYKITFVAFELKFKKYRHDRILFLVHGRHSKPIYNLDGYTRLFDTSWAVLVRVCRLVICSKTVHWVHHNFIPGVSLSSLKDYPEPDVPKDFRLYYG